MATQTQNATRQQLDELDALLQKMLGTPASLPESSKAAEERPKSAAPPLAQAPPPRPPQFPVPEVAYGVPPAAAFAASSQQTTTEQLAAEKSSGWAIDLNPKEGSSVLGKHHGNVNSTSEPVRPTAASLLSVTTIPVPPLESMNPVSRLQSTAVVGEIPLVLRPVAWLNDCCDATLNSFGPFGRMFTSPAGRTLMGYVGLAMLAASIASGAMAWVGWSW